MSPVTQAFATSEVPMSRLSTELAAAMRDGRRLGLLTARPTPERGGLALVSLVLDPGAGTASVWETPVEPGDTSYPSITPRVPQAHWFERAIEDLFGLRPEGHPRPKSLLLHEAWPQGFHPLCGGAPAAPDAGAPPRRYRFLTVKGEGVYEIPVGPIHAGIIEPGHFRFSCLGEVIQNLEIRLGYQHRGIEEQMTRIPWRHARFVAEAASSDTAVGNALAHAMAVEQMLDIEPPRAAVLLRATALEIERLASHLGDLSGICNDIGFAGGSSVFARLRGRARGLGERLTGARFQTAYVAPAGVARAVPQARRADLLSEAGGLAAEYEAAEPLLLDNSSALDRMEGIGTVRPSLARDFGLAGPAGRASGIAYDVRRAFRQAPYDGLDWEEAPGSDGDVLARVRVRAHETRSSLQMIAQFLTDVDGAAAIRADMPDALPANSMGIGIVEAWRGELIHLVHTDAAGHIDRYAIKDPSFNNWTGLAIAARGELVADFPLCNKSFGLSYSGNDL